MPKGIFENHAKASRQHRWKPGGKLGSTGHVKVRVGREHPLADPNGYAYEHVVVWCSAGNPRPTKKEILHHKNEDKTDNRIENLEVMSRSEHNRIHNADRPRDARGRLMSKKAGRLLDGSQWSEFPELEVRP